MIRVCKPVRRKPVQSKSVTRKPQASLAYRAAQKKARQDNLEHRAKLIGAGIVVPTTKKRNKYNQVKVTVGDQKFDSLGEAEFSNKLKLRKLAGEIRDWGRPKPHILVDGPTARDRITYKADFWVQPLVGPVFYIDYKGSHATETSTWRLKVKLWKKSIPDELRVAYPTGEEKIVAPARTL